MSKILNVAGYVLIAFLFIVCYLAELVWRNLLRAIKFPMRPVCKQWGHDWRYHGSGGFAPVPGPHYSTSCKRCGKCE